MSRKLSARISPVVLAFGFLLLPLQPLYGSTATCPAVSSLPAPPSLSRGGDAGEAGRKIPFSADRIIVKFRDSVIEAADMIHSSGNRFSNFAADRGDQLDKLNTRFGVTGITPLFQPLLQGGKSDGRLASRAARKMQFAETFKKARAAHGRRSARAPKQAVLPDLSHIYVVTLAPGTDVDAACRSYRANPNVEYALPSYVMEPQSLPDDPYFSSTGSWGNSYDDLWGLKKLQTDIAWDTAQGDGVVVAVVDTGLDYNHVDIAANVWSNTAETYGTPGVDDDGNGYMDDLRGRHFDVNYSTGAVVSDNDVMDGDGHGTFVAGIIAAVGNNGTGIVGVAPQVKIMPVKIMENNGFNASAAYANGILYAALNGADVINLSWGCSNCSSSAGNPAVADAINVARELGVVVVTSAGNWRSDVKDAFPAGIPDLLTVSATNENDAHADFSNRGFLVDVAAPGGRGWYGDITANNSILSLKSSTVTSNGNVVGGSYLRSSGTSASAAYVSGVAALVLSANPALTTEQVAAIIRQSADDQLGSPLDTPGYDPYFGWGRVNAFRAVAMALSPPADPPQLRVPSEGFSFNIPQALCGQERSFSFDIFNVGGGELTWNLAPPAWLAPLTSSGAGNASPVVKINASSSASDAITVTSNGAGAGTSDLPVSVTVRPDIKLTNCTMAISAAPGNHLWDQARNSNPPAVPDGSGGAYYVWYGPDNDFNYRVFIQHIDSNGTPLWGDSGIRVSSADKFQYSPTVISDGAGGVIVIWIEGLNSGDYADKNFSAQRVSSAGDLLWGSAGIAVTQGGNVVHPEIIPDGSGGAIVGWTHLAGNADDLYAQRVSASGALLWQAGGVPLSRADKDQFALQSAVDGNGGAWFVWIDNQSSFHDVYGQHLDKDGVPLWPQGGTRLNSIVGASEPNVVADGAGGAIVAWYDFRNHPMSGDAYYSTAWDIYAVHLDSAGQHLWSPAETLVVGGTTVTALSESATMLSDGKGGAIIAWLDIRNQNTTLKAKKEVYAQRINGAGQPLWSPAGVRILAADGWDIAPAFIPDGDGGALIAWQDKRFGSLDIFLQQLRTDGSLRWGANGIWAHSGSKDQTDPYLVPLGGNRLAISWNDWTNAYTSTGIDVRGEIVQLCTDHDGDGLYAEGGVCGVVNAGDPRLTIDRSGPGFGSVQSLPSGINCGADCTRPFAPGSVITLHATPAPNSFFRNWEGGGCSGTDDCTVTLTADTVVRAIFAANRPVKIAESQTMVYDSPQHAYNNALNGNTIISRANSFNETLTLKMPVAVDLKGGYDDDFVSNSGNTEINGLVVVNGSVTVENIVIK